MKMVSKLPARECQLHNVQFYNLLPRGIACSSFSQSQKKLACARDDGTIEIWNMAHAPFLEKTIPGGEGVSVEGIAWAGIRLFVVSLAGSLVEWELKPDSDRPRVKQSVYVTGNAAWCIDVSRDERLLAVGTDGGYINVYRLDNGEITYERILDKQEGRIVCCCFDWSGDFLVTGSTNAVRVWDVRKGHAVHKMTVGRSNPNTDTNVWAVYVLKDFTIVSADSRGKMVVYDGQQGTVLEIHCISKADLLCLAMDEVNQILFVSGVEPSIRTFHYVEAEVGRQKNANSAHGPPGKYFARHITRRCHTHDVKTMVTFGNSLVSGGVDGTLVVTSFPPYRIDKYLPLLPGSAVIVAHDSRMVLLRYLNYLEVWSLAPQEKLSLGGVKLLQIRSKKDEHIATAAISPNGRWIVYSTESTIRLFRYDCELADPTNSCLERVRNPPEQFSVCYRVDFTHDSAGMFLYHRSGTIHFFSCTGDDNEEWDHCQSIEAGRWLTDTIHLSAVSRCNRYLVCADVASAIVVFERSGSKWKRSISLPRYKLPPTAIAIQPNRTRLAVAFADYKLFLYDFDQFQFVFSAYVQFDTLNPELMNQPISGITCDPRHESTLLLQSASHILTLRFGEDIEDEEMMLKESSKKKKKQTSGNENDSNEGSLSEYKLQVVRETPRLVAIDWLGEDELVAVQANSLSMVEHLPAPFRRKIYGTA
ncbi:U3 small nucleolar RNA-associated protein 4 homolog [Anopheles nili]|uniref:U3 small nucleolar RNA-associated protein 4 homolog n=1 Tax=Anopheles nili TaxID=185578 RepID=UPI00237A4B1C|nr:U3 small nucleolar RNA-associated protein 4 homolog [Anopheles nili]